MRGNLLAVVLGVGAVLLTACDGGSIPLSEATDDQIEALRDRIPPLEEPLYVGPQATDLLADDVVLGYVTESHARNAAINDELAGTPVVVFSSAEGPTGSVYDRRVDGDELTFVAADGRYRDEQTGTTWHLDGRALDGPLAGTQLEPVPNRSSFWFAYVAAFPDAEVVDQPGTEPGADK